MKDFSKQQANTKKLPSGVLPVVPLSSLETHVKLQQSQEEFLAWLDACEQRQADHDGYQFKKIR